MNRKYQAIDLMKLHAQSDEKKWNQMLTRCLNNNDLNTLKGNLYGIQVGMRDLEKQKLNNEAMCVWFLRLQSSIEKTARLILKKIYPSVLDHSKMARNLPSHLVLSKEQENKRKRDQEFEKFLRKESF